jgi:hypothetical protein
LKDKYTLATDADVTELLGDLKAEGWYYSGGYFKPVSEQEALLTYRVSDPGNVKPEFEFKAGQIVVPLANRTKFKVFTSEDYEEYQAIFGGN